MTCPGCIYLAPQLSLAPDIVKAQAHQMPSDLPPTRIMSWSSTEMMAAARFHTTLSLAVAPLGAPGQDPCTF